MKKEQALHTLQITLTALGGLLFFWLFPLKILSRIAARFGKSTPCPSALSWIVHNPIRRRYMRPVLKRIGIRPGERVLELGPGPGAFTVDAAQQVGKEGKLLVVDIQPKMIDQVQKRVREAGLNNVETHVASAHNLPFEDASIDRVFLITVLPEIPDPYRALDEINRVLKPGGVISVTEEFLDPDYVLPFETVRRVESMGFSREAYFGNPFLYTLNFWKSEGVAYDYG